MSAIGGWLGGGAALITIGLCFLLMRFGHHLPAMTHPWQHRFVILAMYAAGSVLVITAIGAWVLRTMNSLAGVIGGAGPGSGAGWAMVTIGALFLFAAVVVALIWQPNLGVAYIAVVTPLMLAFAPGGIAHQLYVFTAAPAQQLVTALATWAGGA